MSNLLRIALAVLLLVAGSGMAQAGKRVALVIGNSSYKLISPLANPRNDADLMAKTLKKVGFEVIVATDVDNRGMARAVRKFGNALRSAGKNAVGLFYYAGHGVQSRGENYLIPLQAEVGSEFDLGIEAISGSHVLGQMEAAGNALNLVILDACRNNPYKTGFRSGTRGFARVQAPSGALVAFSAAPGQVAADGTGANSPYTAALVEAIQQPGLPVEQMFKRVRIAVENQTGAAQTPWEESSLKGDFYFVPGEDFGESSAKLNLQADKETVFWSSVKDSNNVAAIEEFLKQFPNGTFAGLAKIKLRELKSKIAVGTFPKKNKLSAKRAYKPGDTFKDCDRCPEMVVIPAGSFMMGSPKSEKGHWRNEDPQHKVKIPKPLAVGKFEITFDQFKTFVKDTGYNTGDSCWTYVRTLGWKRRQIQSYELHGFRQSGSQPVVCVNWDDAKAYVKWLSDKTGNAYRLLSEAEWEFAARAGTTTRFHFGNSADALCKYANWADRSSSLRWKGTTCSDGTGDQTAVVGSYKANRFGLHDMHGNAAEWVEDCSSKSYKGAPTDGSARTSGDCRFRIQRGGSWFHEPENLRSADRGGEVGRKNIAGFRVAKSLTP